MSQASQRQAKEKINAHVSGELYQALFEQAADGIFITDEQGKYVEVNQHGCEMLGYTRGEILNFSLQNLLSAEDLVRDPPELDRLRAGKTLLKERNLRCKDGRFLPVEVSARMLTDGRFLSIVRDITKRKQAEEQLRQSNERFRLLAESSLTGIYLIQENLFRYVNPAMACIFGYNVEDITNKLDPMKLVYVDDRPLVAENLRRRIEYEEETLHYEFRGLRKDGTVVNIEVHGRRIEYDGQTGVIGTLVDITERKQLEENLRQNRQILLQFSEGLTALQDVTNQLSRAKSFDNLCRQAVLMGCSQLGFERIGIWFIDEQLSIMRGSFGIDEDGQLRDERSSIVEFRHEGLAWRVFSRKESAALVEHRLLYDHQRQAVGEGDNAMAALWDGDDVIGVISVDNYFTHRPITERQLELLRLYATTLGHLITRKQAEERLRAYTYKLERNNQELQEVAFIASHDLQEPLRKIQAFSDRLQSKYAQVLDERAFHYLGRIQSAGARSQSLIQDLFTFTQITTQDQTITAVNLNEIVIEVLNLLENQIQNTQAHIQVDPLPTIEADSWQIELLFQNLLSNGIKFHQENIPPRIHIQAHLDSSDRGKTQCQISISDNGIGFDPKYLDRIFTVFKRLHDSTFYSGTGIGLALCRKIVECHHGHITAQSAPGLGTTFIITLPTKQ